MRPKPLNASATSRRSRRAPEFAKRLRRDLRFRNRRGTASLRPIDPVKRVRRRKRAPSKLAAFFSSMPMEIQSEVRILARSHDLERDYRPGSVLFEKRVDCSQKD